MSDTYIIHDLAIVEHIGSVMGHSDAEAQALVQAAEIRDAGSIPVCVKNTKRNALFVFPAHNVPAEMPDNIKNYCDELVSGSVSVPHNFGVEDHLKVITLCRKLLGQHEESGKLSMTSDEEQLLSEIVSDN